MEQQPVVVRDDSIPEIQADSRKGCQPEVDLDQFVVSGGDPVVAFAMDDRKGKALILKILE